MKVLFCLFFMVILCSCREEQTVPLEDKLYIANEVEWYLEHPKLDNIDADYIAGSIVLANQSGVVDKCLELARAITGEAIMAFSGNVNQRDFSCRLYYSRDGIWYFLVATAYNDPDVFLGSQIVKNEYVLEVLNSSFSAKATETVCTFEKRAITPGVKWAWGTDGVKNIRIVIIGFGDVQECPESVIWMNVEDLVRSTEE